MTLIKSDWNWISFKDRQPLADVNSNIYISDGVDVWIDRINKSDTFEDYIEFFWCYVFMPDIPKLSFTLEERIERLERIIKDYLLQ